MRKPRLMERQWATSPSKWHNQHSDLPLKSSPGCLLWWQHVFMLRFPFFSLWYERPAPNTLALLPEQAFTSSGALTRVRLRAWPWLFLWKMGRWFTSPRSALQINPRVPVAVCVPVAGQSAHSTGSRVPQGSGSFFLLCFWWFAYLFFSLRFSKLTQERVQ